MDDYLSAVEAAERAGVSRRTILRHIEIGKLDAEKIAGAYIIPRTSFEKYLEEERGVAA